MTAPLLRSTWIRVGLRLAALMMFGVCAFGIYINASLGVPEGIDFLTLIAAPKSDMADGGLYRPFSYVPGMEDLIYETAEFPLPNKNLNPPVVSALLYPLAFLDLRPAYYILCSVQLILMVLVLWRLLRRITPPENLPFWLALLLTSAYFPVTANMLLGQIGLLPFITLGLFWLALENGRTRQAGAWLGLALALKLFVGLVFIWLMLQKRWHLLLWSGLSWVALMLAGLLLFGVENHRDWLHALTRMDWGTQSWNASLSGFASRYFTTDQLWARWTVHSAGLTGSVAALLWLSRQTRRLGEARTLNLGLALTLPLMLLLTPLGWLYYFPLLFLSAVILWRESGALAQPEWLRGGLVLALMLSAVPQVMSAAGQERPSLWREFKSDLTYTTTGNGDLTSYYAHSFSWFVLPDLYTLALLLLAGVSLALATALVQTEKSAHTGT